MNIKTAASILWLMIGTYHGPCSAIPIDQNQIKIHKQNFTDITCSSASHHCVSIGMLPIEEDPNYLIYLSDNDGETWDKTVKLPKPVDETPDNNNRLGIHCHESGKNCILLGTTYIDKKRNIITYHSTDSGLNWNISNLIELPQKSTSDQSIDLIEPGFIFSCGQDSTHCVIATHTISKHPKPLIYTTSDNGYTWSPPFEIKTENLNTYHEEFDLIDINCSKSGLSCVLIGKYSTPPRSDNGFIGESTQDAYTTVDGGSTWDIVRYPLSSNHSNSQAQETNPELFKIACDELGKKCIAIGTGDPQISKQIKRDDYEDESSIAIFYAYRSVDGGKTWVRTNKISQELYVFPLFSLSCDDEAESCIAVGLKQYPEEKDKFDAIAYITYDSGYSWQPLPIQQAEKNSFFAKVFCDTSSPICHIAGFDEQFFFLHYLSLLTQPAS